jgi:hypothetical protein
MSRTLFLLLLLLLGSAIWLAEGAARGSLLRDCVNSAFELRSASWEDAKEQDPR